MSLFVFVFVFFVAISHYMYLLLFIVLFAKNCINQIKSNYLNSHGGEAQEKPPGLYGMGTLR